MHFEHDHAPCLMFDFAGDEIPQFGIQTCQIVKCPIVVTFPFSSNTYIEAILSANRQQLPKALNNALSNFGGLPHSIKTANLKQFVKKSNWYEPSIYEWAE
jgi:hypothetical protein